MDAMKEEISEKSRDQFEAIVETLKVDTDRIVAVETKVGTLREL